jgi:hypothetical protein
MYRKIHPWYLGVALGLMEGLAIFLATIVLVLQGEHGEAFLSKLFPFYTISVQGAFIGLVEGFIDGFIGGVFLGGVYNLLIRLKLKPWK